MLNLHICDGKTGEICPMCRKKIGYCTIHDILFVETGRLINGVTLSNCPKCKIGFGITNPSVDMESIGVVTEIEEATYSYGDL